jgi:hypothetical protein
VPDDLDLTAELDAAEEIVMGDATGPVVTEHANQMSGGGFHVWNTEPYILEIYPLEEKIRHGQQHGGKVYRRRVIVVEDWREVPR